MSHDRRKRDTVTGLSPSTLQMQESRADSAESDSANRLSSPSCSGVSKQSSTKPWNRSTESNWFIQGRKGLKRGVKPGLTAQL